MTPLELVGAGALALSFGAVAGFSSHYFGAGMLTSSADFATDSAGRVQAAVVAAAVAAVPLPTFALAAAHQLLRFALAVQELPSS